MHWPGAAAAVGVARGQSPTPAATAVAIPGASLVPEAAIIMGAGAEEAIITAGDTITAATMVEGVTMEEDFTRARLRQVMRLEFIILNPNHVDKGLKEIANPDLYPVIGEGFVLQPHIKTVKWPRDILAVVSGFVLSRGRCSCQQSQENRCPVEV